MHLPSQLPCQPQEGFFEVVVGFGGDLQILEILLPVEGDVGSLDFSLLDRRSEINHITSNTAIVP